MKKLKINGYFLSIDNVILDFDKIENINNIQLICYKNGNQVFNFKDISDISIYEVYDSITNEKLGFDINIHDNTNISQIEYQFSDEINQMAFKNSLKNVNSKLIISNDDISNVKSELLNLNNKYDNLRVSINDINKNISNILETIKTLQNKDLELDTLKTEVANFKNIVTKDLNELNDSRYDLNSRVVAIEKKIMV